MPTRIKSHFELDVYKKAFDTAMNLFDISKSFPSEEKYSLTDQMRRSSRSVCANLAEAWRKRIYEAAFVSKINDSESESAETQTWIAFAVKCGYLQRDRGLELHNIYEDIIRMLVAMRCSPEQWVIPRIES
ncbi:MAG: four helix bundle protein [Planctomycetaceae bacterium]|nr:four helix bundle protein [Planctomycetaceae bacterium]